MQPLDALRVASELRIQRVEFGNQRFRRVERALLDVDIGAGVEHRQQARL
jgi:hypothetical protein